MIRVNNVTTRRQVRNLFIWSAILFLANIYFGFDNALTIGNIPRWQTLIHVHAGTLGWVTLSVIGVAIWALTGERDVSEDYTRKVTLLVRFGVTIFTGYIVSFGLAFGLGRPFFFLMPALGVMSSLLIWATAIFTLQQLRQQPVVATIHLLVTAALLVASLGSTMGVLLGLEYVIGFFVPGTDRIGSHAGVMDTYLLLAAASIVELVLHKGAVQRWNRSGMFITIAWGLSMVSILVGLLTDLIPLVMVSVPLMLMALIVYIVRGGWRGFGFNPAKRGSEGWIFFGTLWVILWGSFFIWVAANYADDPASAPHWVAVTFVHGAFVGMMTNLLLGVFSAFSQGAKHILAWVEPLAIWLINLGLIIFLALEIASETRAGAVVMGIGVLLGVGLMILRLRAMNTK